MTNWLCDLIFYYLPNFPFRRFLSFKWPLAPNVFFFIMIFPIFCLIFLLMRILLPFAALELFQYNFGVIVLGIQFLTSIIFQSFIINACWYVYEKCFFAFWHLSRIHLFWIGMFNQLLIKKEKKNQLLWMKHIIYMRNTTCLILYYAFIL